MLVASDLKPGIIIIFKDGLFEVLEIKHLHLGRGGAIFQTKIKNLKTGAMLRQNFKPGDNLEEADVSRGTIKYIYSHQGKYCFQKNPRHIYDNQSQLDLGSSTTKQRAFGKDPPRRTILQM